MTHNPSLPVPTSENAAQIRSGSREPTTRYTGELELTSSTVGLLTEPGDAEWNDLMYRSAGGIVSYIPWATGKACPVLSCWLNAEAPARVRPGSRAVVVGSGLGDDVIELLSRGYDATGFDVSQTAVQWARRRFPDHANSFIHADLFDVPSRLKHRHDLVVDVGTLSWLAPGVREQAMKNAASLLGPRGVLVAIARGKIGEAQANEKIGPPWTLTSSRLQELGETAGLKPARAIDDFSDEGTPPTRYLRGIFETI